ncbi:MAG: cob(I)yrinic acid a,c-diamide adenosyltransferase [Candidatus Lokiarchaeota archaeon]|nr:cob(I)yrinic acid a,c-diamide adenosyltransferase [Candidatus Lokiarchaeota archaeon]
MIQWYFGRGKGKTTAAIGQGFRAAGHSFKVYMIQFLKGNSNYGEVKAIGLNPNFELRQFGTPELVKTPGDIDLYEGEKAIKHAKEIISSEEYDVVILDEIGVAIEMGIVDVKDLLEIIDLKPKRVELIITGGKQVPQEVIDKVDLITEMKMIKHYYISQGINARFGIEF